MNLEMNNIFFVAMKTLTATKQYPTPWQKFWLVVACIFLSAMAPSTWATNLIAEADRTHIGVDETLQLTMRLDQQVSFSGPDFEPLKQDFEILNQMRTNQFRNINGRSESWTEWTFVLAPKKDGQLLIPSLKFEDAFSDAISINVTPNGQTLSGEVPDVFVETKVNKDIAYVQEQILLSFSVHVAQSEGNLREINYEELQLPNAVIEPVAENTFRRNLQGRSYYVKEYVYAIYPQQSAKLEIPSLLFVLTTSRGNRAWNDPFRNSRGDLRRIRTDAVSISVDPKPSSYTYRDWVPATNVTLDESWSSEPNTFKVGEPITRTLTLTAEGLTSAQLPPLPNPSDDNFKTYADQPQQDDEKSSLGITGRRMESVAIVPTKSGTLTLPAIEVGWWDTNANQQRTARLPSRQITVAAAAVNSTNLAPPSVVSSTNSVGDGESEPVFAPTSSWPWMLATLICALLALAFFIAWIRARKLPQQKLDPVERERVLNVKQACDTLRRACSDNDAIATRKALIQWAQLYWQDSRITQLQAIISRSQHGGLARELEILDKTLYSSSSNNSAVSNKENNRWQGDALWNVLHNFRKQQRRNQKNEPGLAPLYPV